MMKIENEGDLIAITEWMKDDTINFMAKEGRGLICTPISSSISEQLDLHQWNQITQMCLALILL